MAAEFVTNFIAALNIAEEDAVFVCTSRHTAKSCDLGSQPDGSFLTVLAHRVTRSYSGFVLFGRQLRGRIELERILGDSRRTVVNMRVNLRVNTSISATPEHTPSVHTSASMRCRTRTTIVIPSAMMSPISERAHRHNKTDLHPFPPRRYLMEGPTYLIS